LAKISIKWKSFLIFLFRILCVYIILAVVYILLWDAVISGTIPLFTQTETSPTASSNSTDQPLNMQTTVDMKIYRYGFLPAYWSRIGDLTGYHQAYFAILTIGLFLAIGMKYKSVMPHKEKTLKPSLPNIKERNMNKKRKLTQIVTTIWAIIGFLWFIVYQLLPVLPYDTSLVLVELLNYAMWMMVFASVATLVLPYFKVLYLKIWEEGGEKHE
jgi:hypothetical protein